MEVVLKEDFPALGYVGDKIKVKGGYARNFLIPRGIALEATSGNAKLLRHRMEQILAKKNKLKAAAQEEAKRYEGLILEFNLRIGEKGKSFGAVSVKDIENLLKERGFEVDRKQIRVADSIKAGGDYRVEIKLHSEVTAVVTARVIVERVVKKEASGEEAPKKPRGKKKTDEPQEQEAAAEGSESSGEQE